MSRIYESWIGPISNKSNTFHNKLDGCKNEQEIIKVYYPFVREYLLPVFLSTHFLFHNISH